LLKGFRNGSFGVVQAASTELVINIGLATAPAANVIRSSSLPDAWTAGKQELLLPLAGPFRAARFFMAIKGQRTLKVLFAILFSGSAEWSPFPSARLRTRPCPTVNFPLWGLSPKRAELGAWSYPVKRLQLIQEIAAMLRLGYEFLVVKTLIVDCKGGDERARQAC
jgi:hypothetical protein